jgi:hypothetical protein
MTGATRSGRHRRIDATLAAIDITFVGFEIWHLDNHPIGEKARTQNCGGLLETLLNRLWRPDQST